MDKIVKTPILVIFIDAVRAENLGCYSYSKPTSPNIDNLAKEGVLFEDVYSCTNVTDTSLTTIFSGKYPLSYGIIRHGPRLSEEEIQKIDEYSIHFLPQILRARSYVTLAVDWLDRLHCRGYNYYSGLIHHAKPRPVRKIDRWVMLTSRTRVILS